MFLYFETADQITPLRFETNVKYVYKQLQWIELNAKF